MNIAWGDLGLVLLVGLAAGTGVVTLFAFGVAAVGGPADTDAAPKTRPLGYICFAVCAAIVIFGIYLAIPSLHKFI